MIFRPSLLQLSTPIQIPQARQTTWPSEVKTSFSPADIQTVSETKREGYIYRSPHFEFHSPIRLPHRAVREFSLIFESTYDLANAMPIGLNAHPRRNGYYITLLFETEEDYLQAGGLPGSAGLFSPLSGSILVPLPSLGVERTQNNIKVTRGAASSTLVHEVTHQVMMRWGPLLPIWMNEGFAEITSALPYESGRFQLSRMSRAVRESTGSGPGAGRSYKMVPLSKLMQLSSQTWSTAILDGANGDSGNNGSRSRNGSRQKGDDALQNYRSATLLTYYFLRLDGNGNAKRLMNYINARLQGTGARQAEEKYLLEDRSYEQLQKDLTRAWREEGLQITFIK